MISLSDAEKEIEKKYQIDSWKESFKKNPDNYSKYTEILIYNEILPEIDIFDKDNPYQKFNNFTKSNKSLSNRFKDLKVKSNHDSFSNEKYEKDSIKLELPPVLYSIIFQFIHPQFERLIHNKYSISNSEKISINVLINSYLIYDDVFINVKRLIFSNAKIFFSIKDKIFLNYIIKNSIFLRQNLCNKKNLCTKIVEYGNFEFLKIAIKKKFPFDESTTATAAKKRYFGILKWLIKKGCPYDKRICSYTASNGDLDILKWAHEHDCPWDSNVCKYSARNGYLNCLIYANQNNCPWDSFVCDNACIGGYLDILRWAVENNCDFNVERCLKEAKNNNHIHIVNWIENWIQNLIIF